jgi:hypothetical protein
LKHFGKNSNVKEGLGEEYEYCISLKRKYEIELIPSGHQVIKSEYGKLTNI